MTIKTLEGLEGQQAPILYFAAVNILPQILSMIRETVSSQIYETWFSGIRDISLEGAVAVITVPDQFFADWIEARYAPLLLDTIEEASGTRVSLEFRVAEPAPLPDRERIARHGHGHGLVPRFTLAGFLLLSHNRFPCAAVRRFVEADPGGIFCVVGPPGAGKTHLVNAGGHHALSLNPKASVRYVRMEPFFNSLLSAIREKRIGQFKKGFRNLDLLILDDFQFIKGKPLLQEELVHMIDSLVLKDRKVILASSVHPLSLDLSDPLFSRLMGGLLVEMKEPEPKDRERFLKTTLESMGVAVDPEVISHMARNCHGAMRELEGMVQRLWAYHSLVGGPVSFDSAKAILADMIVVKTPAQAVTERVADFMGIPRSELLSGSRRRRVSQTRHIIAYILREELGLALEEAAEALGGIHHTAIIYGAEKVKSDNRLLNLARKLFKEIKPDREL